jgi:hypothetical protein
MKIIYIFLLFLSACGGRAREKEYKYHKEDPKTLNVKNNNSIPSSLPVSDKSSSIYNLEYIEIPCCTSETFDEKTMNFNKSNNSIMEKNAFSFNTLGSIKSVGGTEVPFTPIALVGSGYDSVTQKFTGSTCVDVNVNSETPSPGRVRYFSVTLAKDRREFQQAIQGSVDASWYLSSAGLSFMSSREEIDSSLNLVARANLNLVARANVSGAPKVWRIVNLEAKSKDLLQKNYPDFKKACGNKFVAGYTYNSRYLTLVKVKATSSSEYSSIAARLTYGAGPFAAKGEASSRLSESLNGLSYQMETFQEGGENSSWVPFKGSPEELVESMWKWKDSFNESNTVVSGVMLRDYSSIVEASDIMPSDESIRRQESFNSESGEKYVVCDTARQRLEYLRSIEGSPTRKNELKVKSDKAIEIRDEIFTKAEQCRNDVKNCVGVIPQCDVADYGWWETCSLNPVYKEGTAKVCGIRYKSGQGEVCGETGEYNQNNAPPCRPIMERYETGSGGEEINDKRISEILGEKYTPRTRRTCRGGGRGEGRECEDVVDKSCHSAWDAKATEACKKLGNANKESWYRPYCRNINSEGLYSCDFRTYGERIKGYETCRDPAFGKIWKVCDHQSFGEIIQTCRHPVFGLESCDGKPNQ